MRKLIILLIVALLSIFTGCNTSKSTVDNNISLDSSQLSEQGDASSMIESSEKETAETESSAIDAPDKKIDLFELQIGVKYACSSNYHDDDYFARYPECIPAITFYEDGTCELIVNYMGGVSCVYGIYSIEDEQVFVEVELDGTIFKSSGTKFMDDQYVFNIINNDEIVIDKGFYTVNAGDTFTKSSP